MPLANYSTSVSAERTAMQVMEQLRVKGAKAIVVEYDDDGNTVAVTWKMYTSHGEIPFSLPVNAEACQKVLWREYTARRGPSRSQTTLAHARNVAWKIIYDWVRAQMAILETEMVTLEQVFLPYVKVSPDETLYQRMLRTGFKALNAGNPE